ncbi:MAG: DNA alkylation repair protein [Trueperaceae bacterium]|nr:DNA alkylation repair protein [Trueperaceae bacterium]
MTPTPDPSAPNRTELTSSLVLELEAELRALATPERAEHEKRYLKSELVHLGARVPDIDRLTRRLLKARVPREHGVTVALAEALWERGVHELRMAAVDVLAERVDLLSPADLPLLERLLREARTWALVDGIAPYVVGPLLAVNPEIETVVLRWADDPDFWLRRAALLTYLLPMRRGEAVHERFAAVADRLLEDREFFVRKAIGWVLRERSKKLPDEVFTWLAPRRARASGLTLREAGKYLSEAQRLHLLGKA